MCRGCGLVMPVHAGPTHAYMGASPACWRLYGQASTLSWGHHDGLPLLRLVVNAYGAQHPGVEQVRAVKSVAVHLMGLCTILERGTQAEPHLIHVRERKPARRTLDLHWLDPPRPNGTLTVRGPLDAVGPRRPRRRRGGLGARRVGGVGAPPRDRSRLAGQRVRARRLTPRLR